MSLYRTSGVASLAILAAALVGGDLPIVRERKDKTCSKCLQPFSNRGAYCPECHLKQTQKQQAK